MDEILSTYTYRVENGTIDFLAIFIVVIYICFIAFMLFVAVKVLIACNIYIKHNKIKENDKT